MPSAAIAPAKILQAVDGSGGLCMFWGKESTFSNWRLGRISIDGFDYVCGEQRMMHAKACLFGDAASAAAVMASASPAQHKAIGRSGSPYDDALWSQLRYEMMLELVFEKAMGDPAVKAHLLSTGSALLVEASPYDPIWGIVLAQHYPRALDPSKWRGQNLLVRLGRRPASSSSRACAPRVPSAASKSSACMPSPRLSPRGDP